MSRETIDVPPGLAGVAVADTRIAEVRGDEGYYHYRGHPATALARHKSLEEVWYLLVHGSLPEQDELEAFRDLVRRFRALPPGLLPALEHVAATGDDRMAGLRTAVSVLAQHLGLGPVLDLGVEERTRDALRIAAATPPLVAALHRLRSGLEPLAADPDLDPATDYLRMLRGERPSEAEARALERYLIATIDHGFNASTFAARVITSTGADVGAAVAGAIGALSGPLHGGAPSRALDLLDAIRTPENAEDHVRGLLVAGARIMGFGHRVYRTEDPRAALLRDTARELGGPRIELAVTVERVVSRLLDELKPGRDLRVNVEYYAGVVMERCGIPRELFTPTFAASRVIGWGAHVLEQAAEGRLIRPTARYVGPEASRDTPAA